MKKSNAKPAAKPIAKNSAPPPRTLAIDIGGTGIKALTLDPAGKPINERTKIPTPKHATPKDIIEIARKLAKAQSPFERVSVGFPGVVKDGVIYTAVNLGNGWHGFDLSHALQRKLKKPVRIANDADIQGLGCMTGHGLELAITLGTGFGSVLFTDGTRIHLELAHHPFHKGKTYEDELGNRALHKKGRKKWNKLLREAIDELRNTFNFDRLFIGGGNSRLVNFKLPADVKLISNEDGLLGGIALWREAKSPAESRLSGKSVAPARAVVKPRAKAVPQSKSSTPAKSAAKPATPTIARPAQPAPAARSATPGAGPAATLASGNDVIRPADAAPARSSGLPSSS
jgi:polyphosphate glucokinase